MPYFQARQVWTDWLLEARRQGRSWRQAGLVSLVASNSLAFWMIWGSMQAAIVPHVVEVGELHEPGEIWRVPPSTSLSASQPQSASESAP
jgi:type IV secretory pathway TrbF-like protein